MAEIQQEAAGDPPAAKKKGGKLPLILGLVLAVALGGGGFFAVSSGLILGDSAEADAHAAPAPIELPPLPEIAYVPIAPLVVGLGEGGGGGGHGGGARFLRFQAQVEVNKAYAEDVAHLLPRVMDVLNTYLRSVDLSVLTDRSALVRLRAQMLRRVQLVTGEGRVRDLLIQEFVLN